VTDDARTDRLTELARKVWSGAFVELTDLNYEGTERCYRVLRPSNIGNLIVVEIEQHPRALDALEAALYALADELQPSPVLPAAIPRSQEWLCEPTARDLQWALEAHYLCDAPDAEGVAHALAAYRSEFTRCDTSGEPPTWATELAAEWVQRAEREHERRGNMGTTVGVALAHEYAHELLAAAQGEP
jgi:hypothetical protein